MRLAQYEVTFCRVVYSDGNSSAKHITNESNESQILTFQNNLAYQNYLHLIKTSNDISYETFPDNTKMQIYCLTYIYIFDPKHICTNIKVFVFPAFKQC